MPGRRDDGSVRPLVAAADLLIGAACPACGGPALAVCAACLERMRPVPMVVQEVQHARDVTVVAAGWFRTGLRDVVVDWKEHGRFPLTAILAHHLALSVAALAGDSDRVVLVPVPTSWRARWRRGDDLVRSLATAAAGRVGDTGCTVEVRSVLGRTRRTRDQAGLGAQDRAGNLAGAFVLRGARVPGVRVVVVDDVVTTGATIAEAVRALRSAGWPVAGAATVAATPPPGHHAFSPE